MRPELRDDMEGLANERRVTFDEALDAPVETFLERQADDSQPLRAEDLVEGGTELGVYDLRAGT